MRAILLAMLVAAGIGLVGSAGVSAAPINGAAIGNAADATSPVETVQHWRWGFRAATGDGVRAVTGATAAVARAAAAIVRGAAAGGGADLTAG